MGNKENEGFIIFSTTYYIKLFVFWGKKNNIEKGQSFGVQKPWLLTTGSLGLPSCRHQKSCVFHWSLLGAEEREGLVFFEFWFWSYLQFGLLHDFKLCFEKRHSLCHIHARNHWQFSSFMVHVSTISYECYTNSNPKSLRAETENR